jgi:hypothetical protein
MIRDSVLTDDIHVTNKLLQIIEYFDANKIRTDSDENSYRANNFK